jgi:hypothetical protein
LEGKNSSPAIGSWVRQERWCGYDIYHVIIEFAGFDLDVRETHWIGRIPNLLNDRKNRKQAHLTPGEDEHLNALLKQSRPSFTDNWNGLVGIRYYPPSHTPEEYDRIVSPSENSFAWPTWEARVYDPFGHGGLISHHSHKKFEDALEVRDWYRNKLNKRQIELFGISLPWPHDQGQTK